MNLIIDKRSIVLQWDAVDDSLTTTYTIQWIIAGHSGVPQVATLTEQTSYTITELTLDKAYSITVNAANICGTGEGFSTRINLSIVTTSTTSSNSPAITASTNNTNSMSKSIATTSSTIVITTTNPMTISTTVSTTTITVINPTTNLVNTTENKSIAITRSNTNIEITTTTVNITKQFTDAVFLSTSPVKTNMADENSKFKAKLIYACMPMCDVISYT